MIICYRSMNYDVTLLCRAVRRAGAGPIRTVLTSVRRSSGMIRTALLTRVSDHQEHLTGSSATAAQDGENDNIDTD